ncbi:ABC transporter ATP-binding protein [Uliginosibacterium aquaticum]|uniref:ATP-binding cassette domain-containing protein n=1 Tax=Uliginosibacterium aquaticum TaxID=2731212 RepID=A0ABX2ICL4_9RHOO|nr:ATP-binding cassette domain-containing protein [Uliginosibacterium aquaticum]NSL54156.1 ATP-binding cassette domain-containing protein [Uliginosibacterium aquaticum]
MSAPLIELHGLRQRWPGQSADCLAITHFALQPGEHLFLHGASGSGKSSLLSLLAGVLRPTAGEIHLLGERVDHLPAAIRDRLRGEHIGYIFQQFNLLPYLSVIDNVLLPCRFSSRRKARALSRGAASLQAEAQRLLSHLDLFAADWQRPVSALSVGQQQRVAAARALIGQPELLLADEPTSALDAQRQQDFVDLLLHEANEAGSSLIFVSHDQRLAAHFGRVQALSEFNAGGAA